MDGLESQVVITSIQKAVTVAGSLCSTSERLFFTFLEVDMRGQFDSGMTVDILQAPVGQTKAI